MPYALREFLPTYYKKSKSYKNYLNEFENGLTLKIMEGIKPVTSI